MLDLIKIQVYTNISLLFENSELTLCFVKNAQCLAALIFVESFRRSPWDPRGWGCRYIPGKTVST
jgi:hypothetical protein